MRKSKLDARIEEAMRQIEYEAAYQYVKPVTHVKMFDCSEIYHVKGIDLNFEGQFVFFLECEPGLIEPYSERLIERKFYSWQDVEVDIQSRWDMKVDQDEKQSYAAWLADDMEGVL